MVEKLRDSLNRSDPNTAHDIFRAIKLGNVLSGLRRVIRGQNAVTGDTIVLPNMAKAERVLSAYARAGAGTPGPLAVSATPETPGVGEVGWSVTGNILFNAADDWTNVDVEYEPVVNVEEMRLDGFPVISNTLALPETAMQAVMLLHATGYTTLGVATQKTVLAPGSVPGAGTCAFDAAKENIVFNAADAVVRADVILLKSGVDIGVPLEALSTFI